MSEEAQASPALPDYPGELLTCSVCGGFFRGEWDPNDEVERGTCPPCAKWAHGVFFGARIKHLREALSPENRAKFDRLKRRVQENVIGKLIERGAMI